MPNLNGRLWSIPAASSTIQFLALGPLQPYSISRRSFTRIEQDPVDGLQLAGALHLLLRWARVSTLALALARSIDGGRLVLPRPLPKRPFVGQEAALADERLSIEDVRAFIAENK